MTLEGLRWDAQQTKRKMLRAQSETLHVVYLLESFCFLVASSVFALYSALPIINFLTVSRYSRPRLVVINVPTVYQYRVHWFPLTHFCPERS